MISSRWAVTAYHCVRQLKTGDPVILVDVDMKKFDGEFCRGSKEKDIALIRILQPKPGSIVPPISDGTEKAYWKSPCRPTDSHPSLSGFIDNADTQFKCVGGGTVSALQLIAHQELQEFSGYSGSPIQQGRTASDTVLVGLLVEQHLNSTDLTKATNVLWAVNVQEVVDEFESTIKEDLLGVLANSRVDRRRKVQTWVNSCIQDLEYAFEAIDEYAQNPGSNPAVVSAIRAYIPKALLESDGGDSFERH